MHMYMNIYTCKGMICFCMITPKKQFYIAQLC